MIYRFDDCELDEGRGELRRGGKPVALQPKPLALLALLIAERHRVVPKDEILDTLWPEVVVTESSLTRAVSLARRAIGDRGERARIRSHARRGYRFVGHASETEDDEAPALARSTSAAPLGAPTADPADPFIGRGEALASLREAWQRAAAGWGSVVTLQGAAGIGKSRLAETFASELAADGQWIFLARSDEGTAAPAFWLWVQVLRELAQCTDLPAHAEAVGGLPAEIARRVPELAASLSDVDADAESDAAGDAPAPEAAAERFLLFDAMSRLLQRCCEERPIALVLEDLHLAGPESLALLEHLATRVRDWRLLVIPLVRDEPRERTHPLTRTLALFARQDQARSIALAGFGPVEVEALVRQWTGQSPPREWTEELLARTEGNPLFLREAVRLIVDRGALDSPGALGRADLRDLPGRILELVQRSLEGLSPETATVVEAAAVIGRQFAVPLLATVAGAAREDVLDALDRAVEAGVVVDDEDRPGVFAFANPLFQEVTVESLRPGRRARLHLATAAGLEELHAGDAGSILPELAHHYHGALGVGDPVRAFELGREAAARAATSYAYEPAARHLEQALAALDQWPSAQAELRMETLLELGRAHRASGERARRREVHVMAMELARQRGDAAGLTRATIDFCDLGEWAARDPEAQERVTEALYLLGAGDDTAAARARLLARQAYNVRNARPEAEPVAREALALARSSEDPEATLEALYTLHFVIAGPDDLAERSDLVGEMRRLAKPAGDIDLAVIGSIDVASDWIIAGDPRAARAERAAVDEIAGPTPHRGVLWHTGIYDAGLALMEGRFDDAEHGIRDAYGIGTWIEHPAAAMCHVGQSLLLQRERGGAAQRLRETVRTETGSALLGIYAASLVAAVRGESGDEARCRAAFEALVDRTLPEEPRSIDWLPAVTELAALAIRLDDPERGAVLAEQLAPYAELHSAVPVTVSYSGPVARWLGLLALQRGDLAAAQEHLEDAQARAEVLEAQPTLARIDADLGNVLLRRGQEKAGREHLERGLERARALGMAGLEAAIPGGGGAR